MKSKILCVILIFAFVFMNDASTSVLADESYNAALENMRNNFQFAYNSEWNGADLNVKLFNIVDKKFSENIKSLQYGTVAFQLALNRNSIVEQIQRDIFSSFRPEYEKFLGRFQETFYSTTAKNLSDFIPRRKALEIINKIHYAIHNSPRFVLEEQGERRLLENIWEKISPLISNPFHSIGFMLLGFAVFWSKNIVSKIFEYRNKDTKLARIVLSCTGVLIMILGLYTTFRIIGNNSLNSRIVMYTNTKDFYITELADAYWSDIESHIKQVL